MIVNNPERELNADLLRQWFEAFGDGARLISEVIDEAQNQRRCPLKEALLALVAERDNPKEIDPRRFGRWCACIEGRIIDGLRLSRGREIKCAMEWRVSSVSSTAVNQNGMGDGPAAESKSHAYDFDRPSTDSPNSPNSLNGVVL